MKQTTMKTMLKAVVCLLTILYPIVSTATDADEFARLRATADSLHSIGRTDSVIVEGNRALEMARHSGNASWQLGAHTSLGVFMRSSGKIDEALKHYDEALKIATTDSFRKQADEEALEEVAALYVNLATLHLDMAHKTEATQYAVTAADWAEQCADRDFKGQIYSAAGSVLTAAGQPDKALTYQQRSYKSAIETGNNDGAMRAAAHIMLTCDRLDRRKEAAEWRERCRSLLPRVTSVMSRLIYYQAECSICMKRHDYRPAIAWFDSILHLDGIQQLPFVMYDCYNNMHEAYSNLGEHRLAYETLLKSNAVRDTLYEQQKAESMRELTVKYNVKEKELALALSKAAQADTRFRLAVALAVLAVVVALFAIYAMVQRRRRHEREMEFAALRHDTERQLTTRYVEGLENERARMARELHDGVCNDLTAMQMMLNDEHPTSPLLPQLDSCRDQVRRISHELMPPEFNYATIDEVLRYYIYKVDKATADSRCTYTSAPDDADWSVVPDDVSLEIYRIVQEAVGNAIKHASARTIGVSLNRTDSGIELTVSDNGKPRHTQAAGIGRRTMKQRAAAVGGSLTVTAGDNGTTVRLSLQRFRKD